MAVNIIPNQVALRESIPIPYTSSPLRLCWSDIVLLAQHVLYIPYTMLPLWPCRSNELDELYPSRANLIDMALHVFLMPLQLAIIVAVPCSLILSVFFPLGPILVGLAAAFAVNSIVCRQLNGTRRPFISRGGNTRPKHDKEYWIFLNGVAVGHHWLQSNIDRLCLTFGREVHGVHNPTSGFFFDLIQCIIQRDYSYFTDDVRDAYQSVREALLNDRYNKVVFIMHSQGGIEGGMVLDWLLANVATAKMNQLEVYTFGNAANHFNNPHEHTIAGDVSYSSAMKNHKAIACIEHYANSEDFVSRWGVLHFVRHKPTSTTVNRFMGRVFERPGKGHQFNQHYMDNMFPLKDGKVAEGKENKFMNMPIQVCGSGHEWWDRALNSTSDAEPGPVCDVFDLVTPVVSRAPTGLPSRRRVKEVSRLWMYRNGMSPEEDHVDADIDASIARGHASMVNGFH